MEDSIKVALATRLDYQNVREQYEDAGRKIGVAADALRTQLDLVASAGMDSKQENTARFAVPDIDRYHWSAGLNLNLPIERKAERNAYRASLITYEAASRAIEQRADEIKLQVRDGWRALDQAKRNYEISEIGVRIAERRVEEQNLLAELGRAKAQDQVDAQNDLASSKNQLTQALVIYCPESDRERLRQGLQKLREPGAIVASAGAVHGVGGAPTTPTAPAPIIPIATPAASTSSSSRRES